MSFTLKMKLFKPYPFLLICLGFCGLMFFIENKNGAFLLNDFKVYYEASREFINDGQPYGQAFGLSSGFFKYSPATLLVFLPYTVFSFETARILHFVLISFMAFFVFRHCLELGRKYHPGFNRPRTLGFLSLLLLFSVVHLTRELHMGNMNLALLLLALAGIQLTLKAKIIPASLLFALLFLVKPYFAILILPLIIAKKWRLLVYTFCGMTIISLLPALFVGIAETIDLHIAWLETMKMHNTGMFSEHTFTSIVFSYTAIQLGANWQYVFILLTGLVYLLIRFNHFTGKKHYTTAGFIGDLFILTALIPNLVITDSQHFLFTLPLLGLILIHLAEKPSFAKISLFVILFFFYGANSNDLLGNPLSDWFDTYSTIGVANLGLIGFFCFLRKDVNA